MLEDSQFNNQGGSDQGSTPPPLGKNQKMAAAGLVVFAILIVVLWVAQLKNNIYGPFNSNTANNNSDEQASADNQAASDEALKNKDTDGDGLSDYDELKIYKTSPYLEDTDSDQLKDGAEVKNSTDPNCPKGKTCNGGLLDNSTTSQTTNTSGATTLPDVGLDNLTNQTANMDSLINQYNASQSQTQASNSSSTNNVNSGQLEALKNIDAASLRKLLIEQGLDKPTLDKISDAELLKTFQELLSEQQSINK